MIIQFAQGYRSRLNNDKNVPAGTYPASEFPAEFVKYVLAHGYAVEVDTPTNQGAFDRNAYLEAYEERYGKSAPSNISDETLIDRVENPETGQ